MADLEERALRRDKGFVVRLVLGLIAGTVFGLFVYGQLTGERFAGCAGAAAVGDEAAGDGSP
jgi:hypothetical protein